MLSNSGMKPFADSARSMSFQVMRTSGGVAPVTDILRSLRSLGGQKVLSLELFNRKYWAMDAGKSPGQAWKK